jgi:hypothetical protein
MLPFFGARPFLRTSAGSIRASASLCEGGEGVVGLVGEEEDARASRGLAAQVPAALEQITGDLVGDEGLARPGGFAFPSISTLPLPARLQVPRVSPLLMVGPAGFEPATKGL